MIRSPRFALPLRVSMVAATLLLVACGLLVQGIAVTSILEHRLVTRIDETLVDASHGWAQSQRRTLPVSNRYPDPSRPPSLFYVRAVDPDGQVFTVANDQHAEPLLPPGNDVGPQPTTVGSVDRSGVQWRAVSVRGPDGELITVARDLSDVHATMRYLSWSRLGIGAGVLLVLGIAGYVMITRSLRPLIEVEQTAVAIAAGQLDRRVTERDPRTEVGRLSVALNVMLAQIQEAVAASDASAASARTSEDRMRRFITDASHELRTPLTTIRGFAELYRQGAARDVEMLMSRIESESRRMGLLVEDLLLLARMDAQRPLEQNWVDLLVLASDAVHDARAIAPNRPVRLEVFDGPGTPEVLGDEARLRQVLSNLVANALQHTPETAAVTVRVGTVDDSAVLEVVDEGPGMSEDDARRVFERFYRADASRTRASGGAGLGLPIVAALIRAHHGTVTVDTVPGKGCVFRVALPRLAATADEADEATETDEADETDAADETDEADGLTAEIS